MDAATDQAETFPAGTMTGQVNRTFPLDEQVAAVAARKSLREAIADYASDPATLDVQVAELRKRVAGMENAIAHAEHFIAQDRLTRLREIALSSAVSHTNQGAPATALIANANAILDYLKADIATPTAEPAVLA